MPDRLPGEKEGRALARKPDHSRLPPAEDSRDGRGDGSDPSNFFGARIQRHIDVDEIDRQILQFLRDDARQSVRALARAIGMSPGAVSERVARLERDGVISGYHADVNPAALGYDMLAIIGLRVAHGPPLRTTLERLTEIPEVERVIVVTGAWDLLVHARIRDQNHLTTLLFDRIWQLAGFQHSETMMMLHERTGPRVRFLNDGSGGNDGRQRSAPTGDHPRINRRPRP